MTIQVAPYPFIKSQFFDTEGNLLVNGTIQVYQAGTTNPSITTYTNSSASVANPNPIQLDGSGRADIWTDTSLSYKFVAFDQNSVQQWVEDNIPGSGGITLNAELTALSELNTIGYVERTGTATYVTNIPTVVLTGDVTASGAVNASMVATLANTAVTAGIYGSNANAAAIAGTNGNTGTFTIGDALLASPSGATAVCQITNNNTTPLIIHTIVGTATATDTWTDTTTPGATFIASEPPMTTTTDFTVDAKGRITGATNFASQIFSNVIGGDVPPSGGGTTKYLRADSSWDVPAGGAGVFTDPGYFVFPGTPYNLVIQWGYASFAAGAGALITFPVPFPNNCLNVTCTRVVGLSPGAPGYGVANSGITPTGFYGVCDSGGVDVGSYWYAIGF